MSSSTPETTPDPPTTTSPSTTTTSQEPTTTTTSPTTSETTTSPTTSTSEETTTSSETTTTTSETTPTETTTSTSSETTSSTTPSSTTSIPVVTTTSSSSSTRLSTSTSTNDGVTQTVVVTDTNTSPSASQSAISDEKSDDGGFFNNTGAVAGVFTVVGLIALVLIVVLATNAIRRRRARKFDDEVAAAAAEANASPRYPFDDYDDPTPGGGYGSYSDPESHGTMSQVPLTQPAESYNMSEFNGGYGATYGGNSAAAGAGAAVGAGAAGIGAANSLARRNTAPHAAYTDVGSAGIAGFGATQNSANTGHGQVQPYNAYAGPINTMPADPYDPYTAGNLGIKRQSSRGANDLLDAAGIGAAAVGAGAAAGTLNRGPSQSTGQTLDRSRSQGTQRTLSPDNSNQSASGKTQESYAAHYQPDFKPDEHQYQPSNGAVPPVPSPAPAADLPNPFARDGSDEDAYGADSFVPGGRHSPSHDDGQLSIRDEEDYGLAGRTLKVANE